MNKTSVAKNFINFLGPNALTGIVSFIIIFPITTHYVTISEFGTRALVFLAVLLVSILTSYGAIWVIQAFYNDFDDKDRSIFITTLYLYGLFLLLAVSSIFYLYSDFLFNLIISWDSSYELYFQISLIRLILRRHESIMLECWTMDGLSSSFLKYRLVDLVAKLLSTYYFLVLEGFGLLGLFYVDITAALISSSFFPFFAKSYMSFNIGLEHLNSIIKIGYPAIPKSIIGQIDKNIISYFLIVFTSLELVGIFNRSNVMTKYYKHIIQALRRTVMPKFILSERKGKPFPVDFRIKKVR